MCKDSNFGRLQLLLLLIVLFCFGLSRLPDTLSGYTIRKVDLLSDLRPERLPEPIPTDSLDDFLALADSLKSDSVAMNDSIAREMRHIAQRDSLYKVLYASNEADSLGSKIEDYSAGRSGLKHFFSALARRDELGRPVRIAFLGDSFIEGDILVGDLRQQLQQEFGGRGVGFVPVSSVAAQFRPTVRQTSEGWKTRSMLTDKQTGYTLPGMVFEAQGECSTVSVQAGDRYANLQPVSTLRFFYETRDEATLHLICNDGSDTLSTRLPATGALSVFEHRGHISAAEFSLSHGEGLRALGVAMEDNQGIVVDNFSLRGNSGLILDRLDPESCRSFNRVREYDLIVLQYGLNVVNDTVMQYGWYSRRMINNIQHIRTCFPQADILLLGVSDRSRQRDGQFETMPAVMALLNAQRQVARKSGVAFWDLFGAMGGRNSMVRYVANNWASKDYTHLSFRGGRELADALVNALLSEKEFYDTAQEMAY